MRQYLTLQQEQELQSDVTSLERQLQDPYIREKGKVRQMIGRVKSDLESQTPPDLQGPKLDAAVKRAKELEGEIVVGMPSFEEMRRCPPGTLGQHSSWEMANKQKIILWKNLMRTIHHGDSNPDLANVERLRPRVNQRNLDGAVVPVQTSYHFPSKQYQENYEEIFGGGPEDPNKDDSSPADFGLDLPEAEKASQDNAYAELKAQLEQAQTELKQERDKVAGERMRAGKERKRAEKEAAAAGD